MASDIHRRRTGRGLKITEEIVMKEEMYEEEEDDLPRQYKYLTAHLETNSPAMNHRVNAYITTQAAMATMARYNEINRLFSESFPSAMALQQQVNQSMYMAPLMQNGNAQYPQQTPNHATPSAGLGTPRSTIANSTSTPSTIAVSSPPALSPASASSESIESRTTPYQTPDQAFPPLDPQLRQPSTSAFTSELPNEVKMMVNVDMNDPMATHWFGGNSLGLQMFGQHPSDPLKLDTSKVSAQPHGEAVNADSSSAASTPQLSTAQHDEPFFSPVENFIGHIDDYSNIDTQHLNLAEGVWESFVDFGSEA
jgi:hypothetical protein